MMDVATGEIMNAKPYLGTAIPKKYCIYGACFTTLCHEIEKFDPVATWHIFGILMFDSEFNTNIVNTSNSHLQEVSKFSKSTITRCLKVLRDSQVLIQHEDNEYINPLVWFKGTAQSRYDVFEMLGQPFVLLDNKFYRKEHKLKNPRDERE